MGFIRTIDRVRYYETEHIKPGLLSQLSDDEQDIKPINLPREALNVLSDGSSARLQHWAFDYAWEESGKVYPLNAYGRILYRDALKKMGAYLAENEERLIAEHRAWCAKAYQLV